MTLTKLKAHTNAILTGDVKLPDNTVYIPLLMQALEEIANRVDCLALITKSSDARVLRVIADGLYIRKPKEPRLDTDKIDIDEELMYAVSNFIASYISQVRPQHFEAIAEGIMLSYELKILETETEEC